MSSNFFIPFDLIEFLKMVHHDNPIVIPLVNIKLWQLWMVFRSSQVRLDTATCSVLQRRTFLDVSEAKGTGI
jgi:hypothetical protein